VCVLAVGRRLNGRFGVRCATEKIVHEEFGGFRRTREQSPNIILTPPFILFLRARPMSIAVVGVVIAVFPDLILDGFQS
jgi:hypothetical protein